MSAALRFAAAAFGYGERLILREVTLKLEPGEVLALVGPNGVGKSTLIRAASGLLAPQKGQILLGEAPIARLRPDERARQVAVVPQATGLPEAFTARALVAMGRTAHLGWFGREDAADQELVAQAMERTATAALADRPVGTLSGGERQRVLIARALAQTSALLLLDEPTAHLDLRHQEEVLRLVRSLAVDDGLAVLLALHDLNLVARFADRVALLSDGRLRRLGSPTEVLTAEELAAVYGMEIHVTAHPIHGSPLILSG